MKREDVKDYKKNIPDNNAGKNDVAEGDIRHSSGKKYKRRKNKKTKYKESINNRINIFSISFTGNCMQFWN